MKKRVPFVAAFGVILLACVFAINMTSRSAQRDNAHANQQPPPFPDHVAYSILFHRVASLKARADDILKKGGKTTLRSAAKQDAELSDEDASALEKIALECEQEVAQKDAEAAEIVKAFKARFPNGFVPHGQTLPPPPPELSRLQQERNEIVMRARGRLRAAMSGPGFQRLDAFAKTRNPHSADAASR